MSGPPRYTPSRRSRFRQKDTDSPHRSPEPVTPVEPLTEPVLEAEPAPESEPVQVAESELVAVTVPESELVPVAESEPVAEVNLAIMDEGPATLFETETLPPEATTPTTGEEPIVSEFEVPEIWPPEAEVAEIRLPEAEEALETWSPEPEAPEIRPPEAEVAQTWRPEPEAPEIRPLGAEAPETWPPEAYAPISEPEMIAPEEEAVLPPAAEVAAAEPEAGFRRVGSVPHDFSELPPGFKLRNIYEGPAPMRRGLLGIYLLMGSLALLALGGVGGYLIGSWHTPTRPAAAVIPNIRASKASATMTLSDEAQSEVDAAFGATKEHRYSDAQKQFNALYAAHPEWPSMGIESARATLYELDAAATTQTLDSLTRGGPLPDAAFLAALLHLTHKEFDDADLAFATAVALDPARPDFYYFWGDCLRSQGKPREAAQKFQEALLRNQYETSENLYLLKLWLSLIQADQEETSGLNAQIDAGLAVTPRPAYSTVFSAAAREIKKAHFKEAAAFITQGRQLTEPVVFQVILQDPTFVQESWRPELAGFYK